MSDNNKKQLSSVVAIQSYSLFGLIFFFLLQLERKTKQDFVFYNDVRLIRRKKDKFNKQNFDDQLDRKQHQRHC